MTELAGNAGLSRAGQIGRSIGLDIWATDGDELEVDRELRHSVLADGDATCGRVNTHHEFDTQDR